GLVAEVARVVSRVALRRIPGQLAVVAAAHAGSGPGQIGEQTQDRLRVLAPGQGLDQRSRVVARFGIAEILVEQLLESASQGTRRFRRGAILPAEQGARIGEIREAHGAGAGDAGADVHAARELAAKPGDSHGEDPCLRTAIAQLSWTDGAAD